VLAVQGCTAIFNGCKPLKMGAIRKPRFSNCDVEKAMDGFFNNILAACPKTLFFDRLRTVQGCTVIFDGCKPLKMGVIRKPRFSNCDVEKATDGFIRQVQDCETLCRYGVEVTSNVSV